MFMKVFLNWNLCSVRNWYIRKPGTKQGRWHPSPPVRRKLWNILDCLPPAETEATKFRRCRLLTIRKLFLTRMFPKKLSTLLLPYSLKKLKSCWKPKKAKPSLRSLWRNIPMKIKPKRYRQYRCYCRYCLKIFVSKISWKILVLSSQIVLIINAYNIDLKL